MRNALMRAGRFTGSRGVGGSTRIRPAGPGGRRQSRLALPLLVAMPLVGVGAGSADAQVGDALRNPAESLVSFWAGLGDATLTRLIEDALGANPNLKAAEARIDGARAARTEAALDLAPVVTASSGYSIQRLSSVAVPGAGGSLPGQDIWDAGVQMSWELDVFGRGRRTLQGRNAVIGAAEEGARDLEVVLSAEVALEYFDLRGTEERLVVAQQNAENQRRSLEVTRERLEAGRGTALDTDRAQAQLSGTLAVIPLLETAVASGQYRLASLLGQSAATLDIEPAANAALPTLPEVGGTVDPEASLGQRADVRGAERQLAAHSAFASAARAEYLPRVSIGGTAGVTAHAFDSLGNSGTPRYAVGPVISWPLLDLGRVKANVDAARASEVEAAAQYQYTILNAVEEMETSVVAYTNARERLRHLEDAAAASERATDLARLRYEEGATGFLDVLDAERTQLEAQDRLALGRAEATAALVAVYRAMGGRWPGGR
ncbi:MAG: efflux transporter outer membrane subunit [Gemmatimonas sp.]|nr:efflux transporter outer membrane subunit [Gemmatimonas sp.]